MPDSSSLLQYSITCQLLIACSQNISTNASAAKLAIFSLDGQKIQPMPGSKFILHYNVTCYLLIGCSQDISNNACETYCLTPVFFTEELLAIFLIVHIQKFLPMLIPIFWLQQHHLLFSHWLQPKQFSQCLIPIFFTVYLLLTDAAKIQIQHGWAMSLKVCRLQIFFHLGYYFLSGPIH